jgi:hypothetical protein
MEYKADNRNHVVILTFLFGSIGFVYGLFQILGSVHESSAGDTLFLAIAVGGVWGVIGLVFGALISAGINGGFWSIPIAVLLVLALQSNIIGR